MRADQQHRIGDGAVNQLDQARRFGGRPQLSGQNGDFQILAHVVAEGRHADRGGLERRQPEHFFDAVIDLALVGGGRRAVFRKQLLGHALIDPCLARQIPARRSQYRSSYAVRAAAASGRTTRKATTSKSLMPANSPFMACVPPGENRLATARSSFLPTTEATAAASSFWVAAHVLAVAGRLVEPGARLGIRQVAADAKPLEAIEDLLGLREGKQHRAVVADMHEIMRRQRIAGLACVLSAASPSARRQKMMPGGISASPLSRGRRDGEGAERQSFQLARMRLEVLREVDAEIGERQVGDGDAGATGLRGRSRRPAA